MSDAIPAVTEPLAFRAHDHSACCGDLLTRAAELTRERGTKLTPVRKRVLEILASEHRALGAYDVLEQLGKDGFGNQPPVAYRALEFLVEQGLVHRIARLNAFMACTHPGDAHAPVFLICRGCHSVAEASGKGVHAAIDAAAAPAGFSVERIAVEALGLCPACREGDQ